MDWNTERRQDELNAWQKQTLNQILGASKPIAPAGTLWRVIENLMLLVGVFGMGIVAIWLTAAFLGFYWEMSESGFAFGRNALRWLLEMPR